jgi:hypothetical protein
MTTTMGTSTASQHTIYGALVMTRSGVPLWTGGWQKATCLQDMQPKLTGGLCLAGWHKKITIPTKQLCRTVADIFKDGTQAQDSSYLEADTFVAASTADAAFIVSIICTPSFPETEVLLLAVAASTLFMAH